MPFRNSTLLLLLWAANALATNAHATGASRKGEPANAYRVLRQIPVPGDGGYDYLYLEVFNACGTDGTLSVIHQDTADKYHLQQKLSTQFGARTLTLDAPSHRVFLATAKFGDKPAASAAEPRPRPPILPGTFVVLMIGN
jgi:hypothetical protein